MNKEIQQSETQNKKKKCFDEIRNNPNVQNAITAYFAVPLYHRIFYTVIALIVIVDGALLFFTICNSFNYLSVEVQDYILEISIQIINACFTLLCAIELPSFLEAVYYWNSQSCKICGKDHADKAYKFITTKYSWSIENWKMFGFLAHVKVFQIFCQFGVEILCLMYLPPRCYKERPEPWFAVTVGLALPLGCIHGAAQGYFAAKAGMKKANAERQPLLKVDIPEPQP